jgi:4-hydroxymandelate oxidase
VARSYLESGASARALVLVAEQSVLHYDPGEAVALPQRHSAVAFMLDSAATEGVRVTRPIQRADVGPDEVAAAFAEELAGRGGDGSDGVVILGAALADRVTVPAGWRRPLVPPPGHHSTGVWWELAGGLTTWAAAGRPVVIADYEPALRYLCVLRLGPAFG